jgi:small-conductance mechanosensitive channel
MLVHDEDAAVEGVSRRLLAQAFGIKVEQAIAAYRDARQPAVLWRHALIAFGALLAFIAAIVAWRWLLRRLRAKLHEWWQARGHDVSLRGYPFLTAGQIQEIMRRAVGTASAVVLLILFYFYLRTTLPLFPWTRGIGNRLFAIVSDPFQNMGRAFMAMVPDLVFLTILFLITRVVLTVIRAFFGAVARGVVEFPKFDRDWALSAYKLVRLLVVALALVVAYPYIPGSQSEAFKGISLFAGLVFSLGSSGFIGNAIAGYSLAFRRAFKLGDLVEIGGHLGTIAETGILVTHLRTMKNEDVVVPNSQIVSSEVKNFSSMSQTRGLILHTTVRIGYETPWRQVEAMLIEAAARTPGLLTDPPPFVQQLALGENAVTYEINAHCNTPERMRSLYSELHRNILDVFNEYGVQIMVPSYEGDPERPKVVPKEQWYTSPAQPAGRRDLPGGGLPRPVAGAGATAAETRGFQR